ncbi:MAG: ADP-ribose pyrophosphatase [Parcubacteria group bacterium GW2011_GWD2_38_11]|nr:MAG: ADP-ribose pyrophosphatase [Parcubacteria group bacterium GW2011_GWD2_38_11]
MKFGVAVKGIINKDGKILVLKRAAHDDHKPGVWETVGGSMDENESPQETLKREVMEEAGIVVEIIEPFNVFSFKKDNGEFKIGITFICKYVSGQVELSEEHSEYKWIEPGEFMNFESVPSLHNEIKKYSEKYYG